MCGDVVVTRMAELNGLALSCHAPARRPHGRAVVEQHHLLRSDPKISLLLDGYPEPAMILNRQRQIVLANDKLAALLGMPREQLLGLNPGEAFRCIYDQSGPPGCGGAEFCQYCGAMNAILKCQQGRRADVQECRMWCRRGKNSLAFDLRVWATALPFRDEEFTVFAVRDTTDDKRRLVLERLFFHDVLNSASGLQTIMEVLPAVGDLETAEMATVARRLAHDIVEQIRAQRDLAAAERGDLVVHNEPVDAQELLESLCTTCEHQASGLRVKIAEVHTAGTTRITTDKGLLYRVLGNLLKNALEASAPGQTVGLAFANDGQPWFRVHNESVMPEEVQAQLFHRSFSTKADDGRGVGAYSVKLLTESYLGGTVHFESAPGQGTTFHVQLPAAGGSGQPAPA
jgi:hypothetical protein